MWAFEESQTDGPHGSGGRPRFQTGSPGPPPQSEGAMPDASKRERLNNALGDGDGSAEA